MAKGCAETLKLEFPVIRVLRRTTPALGHPSFVRRGVLALLLTPLLTKEGWRVFSAGVVLQTYRFKLTTTKKR